MERDIQKLKQGDEGALSVLAWALMDYARDLGTARYPSDASDAVQDVLIDLLKNPERLERFETSEQV
ncbi:MAG: hypothetical protein M3N45_12500 [Actinomycetota bacterium]|nr:hypothetical protein [Actinomycetota bacterium]